MTRLGWALTVLGAGLAGGALALLVVATAALAVGGADRDGSDVPMSRSIAAVP